MTRPAACASCASGRTPIASTTDMSANTATALDMHDAVHILFGCGTSLEGEIAAHVWMKFGTTARIREMHGAVAQDEHRNKPVAYERLAELKEQSIATILDEHGIPLPSSSRRSTAAAVKT
jgi:fructose-1,6-bisphosphatase/sedoheptulose 1,7-bisphosphatase-like protein